MTNDTAFEMGTSNIRFGSGITSEVGMDLADMGLNHVMVVTDPLVVRLPVTGRLATVQPLQQGEDREDGDQERPGESSPQRRCGRIRGAVDRLQAGRGIGGAAFRLGAVEGVEYQGHQPSPRDASAAAPRRSGMP